MKKVIVRSFLILLFAAFLFGCTSVNSVGVTPAAPVKIPLAPTASGQEVKSVSPVDFDEAIIRVSVSSSGEEANRDSSNVSISADGRYIAFMSFADNLVPNDNNGTYDVFVYDRLEETTTLVSVASDGTQGNGWSDTPSISADGRYVAFWSNSRNFVEGTHGEDQVYAHDRETGETTIVSITSEGEIFDRDSGVPAISADGRYVAFWSNAQLAGVDSKPSSIFVHDRIEGTTQIVSIASDGALSNGECGCVSISSDGRYVAFCSNADNLVPNDTNQAWDVFVHDMQTGETKRVSVSSDGIEGIGPTQRVLGGRVGISANGARIVFASTAPNITRGDTNQAWDVYLRDETLGTTLRVPIPPDLMPSGESNLPTISADGRFIGFASKVNEIVTGDTNAFWDVFVYDSIKETLQRVSVSANGVEGNEQSVGIVLSADGHYAAFVAYADNLVEGDTNGAFDVFVVGLDYMP